ncbi:hypothetical protein WH91_09015 [Devosia psychrophila]|uniref:Uncharacterized protein n=1 Tax=Devosia psychrophila TaxID=728005 RepID=A0ABR5DYT2_9HYPH|nr:hypothetical protein WH91_09015 [Devosia psychrophila]
MGEYCMVASPHPLPTSPVEGEVPDRVFGWIEVKSQGGTLPLAGMAGEGDFWPQSQKETTNVR